jgi:hypothetical protein
MTEIPSSGVQTIPNCVPWYFKTPESFHVHLVRIRIQDATKGASQLQVWLSVTAVRDAVSTRVSGAVRVRVTLRLAVYCQSVRLSVRPLRLTTSIFFHLNTCFHTPYVTSSLTRGWVRSLQLLLVLASTVILSSDSRGTRDHILLSQIQDSPNLEGQVPYLRPPGTGTPSYTPRHWVPVSSPPTTRRVMVEVFDSERIITYQPNYVL